MHPTSPAVVIADTGDALSHEQLAARASALHALLLELGLRPGDTVALLSHHRLEVFEVERAVRLAGMHLVALDPIWTLEETAYVVNDSGARVVFTSAPEAVTAVEIVPLTPDVVARYCFDGETPEHASYADALATPRRRPDPTPTDLRLFFSAGTLGRPYGVRRPGQVASALGSRLSARTKLFSASPLSDAVASQLYSAVLDARGTIVTFAHFDADEIQAAFALHRPTMAHVLPVHLLRAMKAGVHQDVSGIETVVLSSAPCPPDVKRWLINAVGPGVLEIYGTTERDVIATITAEESLARPGSVGRPLDALAVPPRDLGWYDDDGYFYPRGDRWSMVETDRGAVYARDFEDVLAAHRKVADVAVVLLPESGEVEVRAIVVPVPGVRPGQGLERELIDFVRGRRTKGPRVHRVDFVESLPRSASGRLVRRRLASRFALMA